MTKYKQVPVAEVVSGYSGDPDTRGDKKLRVLDLSQCEIGDKLYSTTPTVQGEPVGWQFYQDGKWWNGDDRIKDHRKNTEAAGMPVRDVYAASQPTPDAAKLVEALERIMTWPDGGNKYGQANIKAFAAEALAAYRKQGG